MNEFPKKIHSSHKIEKVSQMGRTFVCGDLHGCYEELMREMQEVAFDTNADHLILLGDLTDRGISNYECLSLLREPWCNSILGNHDEIMLNSVNPRSDRGYWRANGGGWYDLLDYDQQEDVQALCDEYVANLPLSITLVLPDNSHIGLLHAEAPSDWHDAVTGAQLRMEALWGRVRIRARNQAPVSNIDLVLVGHTSNKNIVELGNVVYLDTGAGFKNGHLTMIEIGNSLTELQGNIRRRIASNEELNRPDIVFEPLGNYEME